MAVKRTIMHESKVPMESTRKVPKYKLVGSYAFAPLGVETLGEWYTKAQRVLKKIAAIGQSTATGGGAGVIQELMALDGIWLERISIAKQRDNAASLVVVDDVTLPIGR